MRVKAKTVAGYLAALPPDKREAIKVVRKEILKNLPKGYQEVLQYGMISYVIPLSKYPETYNGQALGIAALGAQKNYMAAYLMGLYSDKVTEKWFRKEYKASGKKLDMGKCCVRFKRLEDLPLKLIGKTIARVSPAEFIAMYEKSRKK